MEEQYLQELYDWISSQDPTFVDRYSAYDFAYNMKNNEEYATRMYNWIKSVDNTFTNRYTKKEFKAKIESSELGFMDLLRDTKQKGLEEAKRQAQQQEEQPVVEEPKKKDYSKAWGNRQEPKLSLRHLVPLRKSNLLHWFTQRLIILLRDILTI